ncbi:MAG: hypothetical protein H6705_13025 [Myxococcales bacterium]|nr:hypothetical protein [Myxococcales bacterium]
MDRARWANCCRSPVAGAAAILDGATPSAAARLTERRDEVIRRLGRALAAP